MLLCQRRFLSQKWDDLHTEYKDTLSLIVEQVDDGGVVDIPASNLEELLNNLHIDLIDVMPLRSGALHSEAQLVYAKHIQYHWKTSSCLKFAVLCIGIHSCHSLIG